MESLYLVPWIEIEYGWGDRNEGYKVFSSLDECISSTKESSSNGNYEGGYFGPERPLQYYEVPFNIEIFNEKFVKNLPKFRSEIKFIS